MDAVRIATPVPRNGTTRRFTRAEFLQMGEAGLFEDERVELLDGQVFTLSPIGKLHDSATLLVAEALRAVFGPGFTVREAAPVAASPHDEPVPDVYVLRGKSRSVARSLLREHATRPPLVVEVADTSLTKDRELKAPLYACAGIPEYWILDLRGRRLEIYRKPVKGEYRDVRRLPLLSTIRPLLARRSVRVADLIPLTYRRPRRRR